jgi:uncharacterized protein
MNHTGILNILIKSGNICNVRCAYCYDDISGPPKRFSRENLVILMKQLSVLPYKKVIFAWHGGEPLTAGIDYFREALKIQVLYKRNGQEVYNCLHTNAVLINEGWLEFFKKYNFAISLSLDGPKDFHDALRKTISGKGTFDYVYTAMKLIRKTGLSLNVSVTVRENSWEIADELYALCKNVDVDTIELWPLFQPHRNRMQIKSVSEASYIEFLRILYSSWILDRSYKRQTPAIGIFDNLDCLEQAGSPRLCWYNRDYCSNNVMIDVSGDVYPCDSFQGDSAMCVGNFHDTSLEMVLSGKKYNDYIRNIFNLQQGCEGCRFKESCNSGCPFQRYFCHRKLLSAISRNIDQN